MSTRRMRPLLTASLAAAHLLASLGCSRSDIDVGTAIGANGADGGFGGADSMTLDGTGPSDGEPPDGSTHDGAVSDGPVLIHPEASAESGGPCGPTTCAVCCQPDGTCAKQVSDQACGSHGAACAVCPTSYHCDKNPYCIKDSPGCGPGNCDGCCWMGNYCLSGFSGGLCGHQGETCTTCPGGLECTPDATGVGGSCEGNPPPCSPATCDGCCYGPICATGTQDIACGTGGVTCVDCTSASKTTCRAGACGG
jgi:hypothetical protein